MKLKLHILLLIIMVTSLYGCSNREGKIIDEAYRLTSSNPDSAIALLDSVNRHHLSERGKARYALVYTMAQDKSGLDVDNDSLLDIAYTYYNNRLDDSLYAKCMYYTGKYYLLNGMSEKALECFRKSAASAKSHNDNYTQSLALNRMSKILSYNNTEEAVSVAKAALRTYLNIPKAPDINKVYLELDLCEALKFDGQLSAAKQECIKAMKIADTIGDCLAISAACQNMSNVLREEHNYCQSLLFSRKAYRFSPHLNTSLLLNLSWAYLNVDSLKQCKELLSKIRTTDPASLYTQNYLNHIYSIKEQNYTKAIQYADSAYYYIEKMYGEEMAKKENYYINWSNSQHEKGVIKGKLRLRLYLLLFVIIAAISVIMSILYAYKQQKAKNKAELLTIRAQKEKQQAELQVLKVEQEKQETELRILKVKQEKQQAEKLHQEKMMKQKERQISAMRRFILKKVDTAQRLEEIREGEHKCILSESDWENITMFVDSIEDAFVTRLKSEYASLSQSEIRFLVLIRARIPAKSLAKIYNVQEKSIKQKLFVYKKKFNLVGESTSLRQFIEAY